MQTSLPFSESFETVSYAPSCLRRKVVCRDGSTHESLLEIPVGLELPADVSNYDQQWLRSRQKPPTNPCKGEIRVVDLFSGAGGMSLGLEEGARALGYTVKHVLAADIAVEALDVYKRNFSPLYAVSRPIEEWIDGVMRGKLTKNEAEVKKLVGRIDLLVGGPPCQGHSDLNNYTRRDDPKNNLYEKMARFAEVIEPSNIVIENVPGVRHDKGGVYERTIETLKSLGYFVDSAKVKLEQIGVPQMRQREIVIASRNASVNSGFLKDIVRCFDSEPRSVSWAISDLLNVDRGHPVDWVTKVTQKSQSRINWLYDNNQYDLPDEFRPDCHRMKAHTYKSVYGRLFWERPSWTITTGFQVMGQGRFLHPLERRVITSHEAARLQFFPDFFDFGVMSRKAYAKMIGNAVPPKLAYVIFLGLFR